MVPSIIFPILLHSCHTTLCKKSHNIVTLDDYQSFISKIYHQSVFHFFEIHTSLKLLWVIFKVLKQTKTDNKETPIFDR